MFRKSKAETIAPTAAVTEQQKPTLGWGPSAAIVVSVLAYITSQIVLIIPIFIVSAASHGQDFESVLNDSPWMQLALTGVSAAGLLLVLWLFLKSRKLRFNRLGFARPKLSDFGWLGVATFVYFIILIITMSAASHIPGFNADQAQDVGYGSVTGWQLILAFVGLVILPPLAEEMLFRGFLYRGLATKWPKIIAALVTSFLFALVHFQWNVGLDVFILSLVLIALYEKTKNLWMCVSLHAIKNFIAFLALFVFASMWS